MGWGSGVIVQKKGKFVGEMVRIVLCENYLLRFFLGESLDAKLYAKFDAKVRLGIWRNQGGYVGGEY